MPRTAGLLAGVALAATAACSGGQDPAPEPPGAGAAPPAPGELGERQGPLPTVEAQLAGVDLVLEVADDDRERATGLMGRDEVPPGTGMVFRFPQPVEGRFYMYRVPIPLRAVFLRDGAVVSTVVMPPCTADQPGQCPTYGADGPFDTVVETAPETLADVAAGDVLREPGRR